MACSLRPKRKSFQSELVRETVENPQMRRVNSSSVPGTSRVIPDFGADKLPRYANVLMAGSDVVEMKQKAELENVLVGIYRFILVNIQWDVNPLPHLRKCFPGFEWRYRDVYGPQYKAENSALKDSDYIWVIPKAMVVPETNRYTFTARQIKPGKETGVIITSCDLPGWIMVGDPTSDKFVAKTLRRHGLERRVGLAYFVDVKLSEVVTICPFIERD